MKRREFIINSAITLAGTMFLTGCGHKETTHCRRQIQYRTFQDMAIPLLSLGCMRLPMKNNFIDVKQVEQMAEYAISHGANYFDTAYMYIDGKSENVIGKVLKNYKRKDIIIADKSPIIFMKTKDDVKRIFEEQLTKKVQTDYFDFYMVHNINENTVDNYRNFEVFEQLMEFKKQGLVKHVGFSFHGKPNLLKEVVKEHPWEFCQLQINYLDWTGPVKSQEQYEIVTKAKIPVIAMEPLRGGGLCNLTPEPMKYLKKVSPNETPTSYALKWVANRKNIFTILSGTSSLEQMKENINTFTAPYIPLSKDEDTASEELRNLINKNSEIGCTTCRYCMDACPLNIAIPEIFSLYNAYKADKNKWVFNQYYNTIDKNKQADKCIKCGLCMKHCPQNLPIPELLAKIDKEVKSFKF